MFLLYEQTSVFCYIRVQALHTPLESRNDMKLNFAPVIPCAKELLSVVLTSSRDRCEITDQKSTFTDPGIN